MRKVLRACSNSIRRGGVECSVLLRSKSFWILLFGIVSYWVLAWATAFYERIEILNALLFGVGMAVAIAYGPRAYKAIRNDDVTFYDQLILGITLSFLSRGTEGLWRLVWRALEEPVWMQRHDVVGFFLWLSILGGILHLTSPRTIKGEIPSTNLILLGSAFGIAASLAAIVLFVYGR